MHQIKEQIKKLAQKWHSDAINIRRHLHTYPELSYNEFETIKYIRSKLTEWAIPFQQTTQTGIVALIEGNVPNKNVTALRSDHDALPIFEQNTIPYKSVFDGKSHMCGHDAHTSSNLIAARILWHLRDQFEGTVKLLFQPGEEFVLEDGTSGAGLMISGGALSNPIPTSIIAQHVNPSIPCGKIAIKPGNVMASVDTIKITVKGKGGHAAIPHLSIDPVMIASHIVIALQSIVSRFANPLNPTVLTIGKISGGDMFNVIPDKVELLGTLRTYDEKWREEACQHIHQITQSVASAFKAEVSCHVKKGPPCLVNNDAITNRVKIAAVEYLGEENVLPIEPYMTGEDFAFYAQKMPACFYWLGVRNESKGITSGLHTSTMDIDENALEIGPGLFAYLAISELNANQ